MTGLRAHTRYEFRVIATNILGRGTPSSPLEVTTAEHGQLPSTSRVLANLFLSFVRLLSLTGYNKMQQLSRQSYSILTAFSLGPVTFF